MFSPVVFRTMFPKSRRPRVAVLAEKAPRRRRHRRSGLRRFVKAKAYTASANVNARDTTAEPVASAALRSASA
jgi:hypothetical protein